MHGASALELIVGFHKVGTGLPSLTWPQSVEEALSFGWIDGVRKRIDDSRYLIRFTPRRVGSIWSTVNIALVGQLQEQGRMQAAGLAAFARRSEHKSSIYAYEQAGPLELSAEQVRAFAKNKVAWRYWQGTPPSYRKTLTHWVVSARQEATRVRRLELLVQACAQGLRLR